MASIVVNGDTSGSVTLSAPAVAGTVTVTLPSASGTMAVSGGSPSFTTITTTSDASISGLTVGKGGGADVYSAVLGASTLPSGNTGQYNIAVGYGTLASNTNASNSVAIGPNALNANTTGGGNIAIGRGTMLSNTSGGSNTAIGVNALQANTTATGNTAVGYQAGYTNTTSQYSSYFGYLSGQLTTGSNNTFVGAYSGQNTSSGTLNTFVGVNGAGYLVTTGAKNTILGAYTGNNGGLDIRTASNYVVLSDGDGNPVGYYKGNNQTWVFGQGGTGSTGDGNIILNGAAPAAGNGAYIGGQSNGTAAWAIGSYRSVISGTNTWFTCQNSGGGGVYLNGASATSWTAVSSDARQKKDFSPVEGLAEVMQVVPTKFRYEWETESDPIHMGFTAQNLLPVIPDMVVIKEELHEDGTPLMTVTPDYMIPVLVKAIQELKAIVDAQAAEIAELKAKVG